MHTLFFREKLQKYKYAVDTVTNAKELVVDLSRADFSWEFLLVDWKLAQSDQFALMFELRKNPLLGGFIPVIAYGPKLESSKKANIGTLLKQVSIPILFFKYKKKEKNFKFCLLKNHSRLTNSCVALCKGFHRRLLGVAFPRRIFWAYCLEMVKKSRL